LTIGMGGAVLLLLLGTQILDWYWVVLLAVASLGAGLYRARKKIPSAYLIAQWIDRRLNLADTLSTANYFSEAGASATGVPRAARLGEAEIRSQQRQQAETLARAVDVRKGIPFIRPRYLYPALILAAVAFGMFVLRYAVTGSLSLRPSLARIAFDTFFPSKQEQAKANRKQPDRSKMDPNSPDDPQGDQQQDAALEAMDRTSPADPQAGKRAEESKQGERSAENDANKMDTSQQEESQNGEQKNGKQAPQQGGNSQNQNLMDKLRDVMSNMMNKMTSSGQNPPQQSKSSNGQPDKGKPSNKKSPNSSEKADENSQSSPEQAQNDTDASNSDKGTDKTASPDGKSGIGASEGDKKAREAEQLQIMGKISEILGKRSAGVSGEVMVEVGSSKQQLKTPWEQSQATHAEAGGEIHRDEVPLIYQQFVEQYFEQIRKPAAKPAAKTTQQ
jgi:hypothetical protein